MGTAKYIGEASGSPIVKLATLRLDAPATEMVIDFSGIDVGKYAKIEIVANVFGDNGKSCSVYLGINDVVLAQRSNVNYPENMNSGDASALNIGTSSYANGGSPGSTFILIQLSTKFFVGNAVSVSAYNSAFHSDIKRFHFIFKKEPNDRLQKLKLYAGNKAYPIGPNSTITVYGYKI